MNKAANNTGTNATATAKAPECTEAKRDYPESPMQKLAREAADEEATRISAHITEVKHNLAHNKSEVEKLAEKLNIPKAEIEDALNKREISLETANSLSKELDIPLFLFNVKKEDIKKAHKECEERYNTEKKYTERDVQNIISRTLEGCISVIIEFAEMESEPKIELIKQIAAINEAC